MSRDPITGELVDPFGGRDDLLHRRLRMVDRRTFGDDSLRVLRGVQFAARFDLEMEEDTKAVCRTTPLDDLPAERIWGELEKLLLEAERPSIGLRLAWDLGVVHRLFPEFVPLATCRQDPEWHPEGDVWTHTLMVVDEARQRIEGLERGPAVAMMLGALCHDLGKPETTIDSDGRVKSPGHEDAGLPLATKVLDRLNVQSLDGYDVRHAVLGLVAEHMRPNAFLKSTTRVSDGALPPARAARRSRAPRALRGSGLPGAGRCVRLFGQPVVSRARALARRRACAPAPVRPGTASARAGRASRASNGRNITGHLRPPARR